MRPKGAAVFKQEKDRNAAPQPAWEQRDSTRIPISKKRSTISAPHLTLTATPHRRAGVPAGEGLRAG